MNEKIAWQSFLGILSLLTSAQNFVGYLRGIELILYYLAERLQESVLWLLKFCLIFFFLTTSCAERENQIHCRCNL